MKEIQLDFTNRKLLNNLIDNRSRVIQEVKYTCNIWLNDWFLNEDFGIDYLNCFDNEALMSSELQTAIENVLDVQSINSFNLTKKIDDSNNFKITTFIVDVSIVFDNEVININEIIQITY
jgi:hypothetical protein